MSYKKLQIWILAREVVIEVHEMTMKLYEEGSRIRMPFRQMMRRWIIWKIYGR